METKYIVISTPDNCSGNWIGNHTIINDDCTLDEVRDYLIDEGIADRDAKYLGFDKASTNTLSYMTVKEYEAEYQDHIAFAQ